ncbi:MAG: hypothetical protein FD156_1779 [Nitrospirae bacterium]|nr:MAG: hypothetical protein FD156_1779 [Nitrospirota bacterium]
MKKANVLFLTLETDFIDNFGIAVLSAVAKKMGWRTSFFVFNPKAIDEYFSKIQPTIVCYSCMSSNYNDYLRVNSYLKSKYNFVSIMGGPHPTFFPEIIHEEGLDYICRGEGELAFAEFLQKYQNGEDTDSILNFHSKRKKNPVRDLIRDLDDIPFPDRSLIFDNTELKDMPLKTFMSSRGCPYPCTYCYNKSLKEEYVGKGQFSRVHSVDRMIEEIKYVKSKYPLQFVKFEDDLFAIKMSWLDEFAKKYRNEINLPFNCLQRIDLINKDRIGLLKTANCHSITVAIDSANSRIRNEILGRCMKLSNHEIIERIHLIKDTGINVFTNQIIAVPTSTIQDELDAINLNISANIDFAGSTILVPYQGTEIWKYCEKHNLIDKNSLTTSNFFHSIQKKSALSCFSKKEKEVQWNLSLFFVMIIKLRLLRRVLIWIAMNCKPNPFFAIISTIFKGYYLKKYIYPVRVSSMRSIRMVQKAFSIELSRMLGKKRTIIKLFGSKEIH